MPDETDLLALAAAVPLPLAWEATGEKDNSWAIGVIATGTGVQVSGRNDDIDNVIVETICEGENTLAYPAYLVAAANAAPALVAERERLRAALERIAQWADAYPPDLFPDQNLQFIDSVLREAGCSMSGLHGQWGRHIAKGVGEIARAALAGPDGGGLDDGNV
jgi:hypothetical protein